MLVARRIEGLALCLFTRLPLSVPPVPTQTCQTLQRGLPHLFSKIAVFSSLHPLLKNKTLPDHSKSISNASTQQSGLPTSVPSPRPWQPGFLDHLDPQLCVSTSR